MDLLCILFEAKERGYASNPDGTPRSDRQIVDAINGSSAEEKLAALSELEKSGVLSRDSRGVLFSRRMSRLADLSEKRRNSGSKGGSKTQANRKQTTEQKDKQKGGVSASDSVSDSDTDTGHTRFARVSSRDARATTPEGDMQGIWETFRQAFNATPNAEPYNALGCPTAAFDIVTDPAFQTGYRMALDKLAASTFFDKPAPMTWFLRHWDRLLAGEFRERFEKRDKPKQRIVTLDDPDESVANANGGAA